MKSADLLAGMSLGRNRDVFPMPLLDIGPMVRKGLSRGTRQRVQRTRARILRVNEVLTALNGLYDTYPKIDAVPNAAQKELVRVLWRRVSEFKIPVGSHDATYEARRALLGVSHPYSKESCTVVAYDPKRVSIPSIGSKAVPLRSVLSGRQLFQLDNFESEMLKDDFDLHDAMTTPAPQYTDSRIRASKSVSAEFHRSLFNAGLLRPVRKARGRVTPFFVIKKNGWS